MEVAPQPSALETGSIHALDNKELNRVADEAAYYLHEHEAQWANYSPSEAKRVLRKIDWRLMPLLVGTITIAAVDVHTQHSRN